jgi:hypothetical protein
MFYAFTGVKEMQERNKNPPPSSKPKDQMARDLADILLTILISGLVIYLVMVFLSYTPLGWFKELNKAVSATEALAIGIPCATVAAFGIVALLLRMFPPDTVSGSITIKLFGAEFTGPAGPVTLWLMCFLAFIFAVKTLH